MTRITFSVVNQLRSCPGSTLIDHPQVLLRPRLEFPVDQDPPVAPGVDGMSVLESDGFDNDTVETDHPERAIAVVIDSDYEITGFH
jgi:hypothetical protein